MTENLKIHWMANVMKGKFSFCNKDGSVGFCNKVESVKKIKKSIGHLFVREKKFRILKN